MTTTTLTDHIAGEIRAEMARQRMSQARLAAQLGFSQPKLSRHLNSGHLMSVEFIQEVADILDVPVAQLLHAESSLTPISYDAAMLEAA